MSNIKTLREKKKITQEELARKCNITTRTIQNLEKSPNKVITNLYEIKKALEAESLDELFIDK